MLQHPPLNTRTARASWLMVTLVAAALPAAAVTTLSLSESSGPAGSQRNVPVRFTSSEAITGLQLDISVDNSRASVASVVNHSSGIMDTDTVLGKQRVVLLSEDGNPFADGVLIDALVDLAVTVPQHHAVLSLGGVVAARSDGSQVAVNLLPYGNVLIQPATTLYPADFRDGGHAIEALAFDTAGGSVIVEYKAGGTTFGFSTSAPHAVQWTPATDGAFVISVSARNSLGHSADLGSIDLNVEFLEQYSEWAATYFGADATDPLIAGPDAAPKGIANIFLFALAQRPDASPSATLPAMQPATVGPDTFPSLVYQRPRDFSGISYTVEHTTSLDSANWASDAARLFTEEILEDGPVQTVRVRSRQPLDPGNPQFMRLRVEFTD